MTCLVPASSRASPRGKTVAKHEMAQDDGLTRVPTLPGDFFALNAPGGWPAIPFEGQAITARSLHGISKDAARNGFDGRAIQRVTVSTGAEQINTAGAARRLITIAGVALFVSLVAIIVAVPFLLGIDREDLQGLGLAGVFFANFLGNASVLVPVPAIGVAGQALIAAEASTNNLIVVSVVGGFAMALAEITAYVTGVCGRALHSAELIPMQKKLGEVVAGSPIASAARWARRGVDKLMRHYGGATLFVLSAIPNPVFEFAGITAGATHMGFWRFLVAVGLGKITRAFMLATLGDIFL